MSLDFYIKCEHCDSELFWKNITHNLTDMADEAGIWEALWRPEQIDCKLAKDIVSRLEFGLKELKHNPEKFKKFNPKNGWGTYEGLIEFVEEVLKACNEHPEGKLVISR